MFPIINVVTLVLSCASPGFHSLNDPASLVFSGVDCRNAQTFISVGRNIDTGEILILRSTDSGVTWSENTPILPEGIGPIFLRQVCCAGNSDVWYACGYQGVYRNSRSIVLKSVDDGYTWHLLCEPQGSIPLNGIVFPEDNTGFTTGGLPGGNGIVLLTNTGGVEWEERLTFSDANWGDIEAIDCDTIIVAGSIQSFGGDQEAVIARSTDGGNSWSQVLYNIPGHFISINCNGDDWFASGDNALLYRSNDSGLNWNPVPGDFPDSYIFRGIHFIDTSHGVIAGFVRDDTHGLLFTTDNGGVTWSDQVGNNTYWRFNEVVTGDGINWVAVGKNGQILYSANYMNRWEQAILPYSGSGGEESATHSGHIEIETTGRNTFRIISGTPAEIPSSAEIYDLAGRTVFSGSFSSGSDIRLDLNCLNRGIYVLRLVSGESTSTQKLCITD